MADKESRALATLDFLEAAYAWGIPDDEWLRGVLRAVCAIWGNDDWGYGHFYDARSGDRLKVTPAQTHGVPPQVEAIITPMTESLSPEVVRQMYRSVPAGFGSSLGTQKEALEALRSVGKADLFGLNGLDPSGVGCVLVIGTSRFFLEPDEVTLYQRLATHLSSAYRVRRRLRVGEASPFDAAEVILDGEARILEARAPAQSPTARAAVTAAACSIREARQSRSNPDPSAAWWPRVRARWTLLDAISPQGDRYIVARENQASAVSFASLTDREREVVVSAAYGRSNKEIAYDLGISHSTTRVLLARACARLGVRSREEMLDLPAVRAMRGEGNPAS